MLNIILDGFPEEYEGYLIRTDFRIGIQIGESLNDVDLAEPEKLQVALKLLYGAGIPSNRQLAEDGLKWFMRGGQPEKEHTSDGKPPTFDFEQDNRLTYSAFRARYGIDLTRERLHWFAFLAMLDDIRECTLADVMGVRGVDLTKLSESQKKFYAEMKEKYRIEPKLSQGELAKIAEFEDQLNG